MKLREATQADSRLIFNWRNESEARAASRNTAELSFEAHDRWFARTIANPYRHLLVAEGAVPLGYVRLDYGRSCEISIVVDPRFRGRGIGPRLIRAAVEWARRHDAKEIEATVRSTNTRSLRAFKSAGFRVKSQNEFILLCAS